MPIPAAIVGQEFEQFDRQNGLGRIA